MGSDTSACTRISRTPRAALSLSSFLDEAGENWRRSRQFPVRIDANRNVGELPVLLALAEQIEDA